MALNQKHYCNQSRCRNITIDKYCVNCQRLRWRQDSFKRRDELKFYKTKEWKNLRKLFIRAYPFCNYGGCDKEGRDVDHVKPIIGVDGTTRHHLKLDWDNLQTLCPYHHKSKTSKEIKARQAWHRENLQK